MSYKIRCHECKCFVLGEGETVVPETLPEPTTKCDRKPTCPCHTGVGLMPRFEVIQLAESADDHAKNYRRIDRMQ